MALPISSSAVVPPLSVGIDLGGSYARALLADGDGREVGSGAVATPRGRATDVVDAIVGLARAVCCDAGVA